MNNLTTLEFNNQRIMTTKVLAEQFGTEEVNISKNFKRNETRFIEGKHFFKLQGEVLKEFKTTYLKDDSSLLRIICLYLWTKKRACYSDSLLNSFSFSSIAFSTNFDWGIIVFSENSFNLSISLGSNAKVTLFFIQSTPLRKVYNTIQ